MNRNYYECPDCYAQLSSNQEYQDHGQLHHDRRRSIASDVLPVDNFVAEMKDIRESAIRQILSGKYGRPPFDTEIAEPENRPDVVFYLQLGVYPEWREVHFLSRQIQRLDDAVLVYRISKQIADEGKHTKVLRDQLIKWNADPDRFWYQPIYQWSAAFDFMDKLTHPAEYFACSNFIGEGLFLPTIMAPMAKYAPETFEVYVKDIMPDEPSHIAIGEDVIRRYCTTYEMQERVRRTAITLAKQYCIGYQAATMIATRAKQGEDPGSLRDSLMIPPRIDVLPAATSQHNSPEMTNKKFETQLHVKSQEAF